MENMINEIKSLLASGDFTDPAKAAWHLLSGSQRVAFMFRFGFENFDIAEAVEGCIVNIRQQLKSDYPELFQLGEKHFVSPNKKHFVRLYATATRPEVVHHYESESRALAVWGRAYKRLIKHRRNISWG